MNSYFGYEGKVCVVTGAASGMGRATAELLIALGAEVYALDVNQVQLDGAKKFITCNLGSKESIDTAFAELPQVIHKFFGIAGISGLTADFTTTLTVNFVGNKYITEQYLVDRLVDGPVGAIAYMSSQGGAGWKEFPDEYKDFADAASWEEALARIEAKGVTEGKTGYILSKRALIYYTKKMASMFGGRNVRVNTVGPGNTVSGLIDDFRSFAGSYEKSQIMWGAIRREATSEEQAKAIMFLNSDLAEMISGQALYVDGAARSNVEIGASPLPFDPVAGPLLKQPM